MTNPETVTGQRKPARRALAWAAQELWPIRPESLELMVGIATREHAPDIEALMAKRGDRLQPESMTRIRGRTAIIQVEGPIFRYADFFSEISGATTFDNLARDLREAIESSAVDSIVLEINSPGGMLTGTSEFSQMVKESPKPVIAYVDGMAASAAYWIASACERIVINDTGLVGSIGVVSSVYLDDDPSVIEIVSTQSPGKRPNLREETGRKQVQAMVDELADVFIDTVAGNRGVKREKVLADFGAGALKIGKTAVAAGMADDVGSLESLLTELAGPASSSVRSSTMKTAKGPVTVKTTGELQKAVADGHTVEEISIAEIPDAAALRVEGATAERSRIKAVEDQAMPGHEALIQGLKFDGKTTGPEAAVQVLNAERATRSGQLANVREDASVAKVAAAAAPAPGAKDKVDASLPVEERCKAQWQTDPELRSEFGSVDEYIAFTKANEGGQVRIFKKA